MKIGFLHRDNHLMNEFLTGLRARLAQHEIASWVAGNVPPAHDFEVLIATGEVSRDALAEQPRLGFLQMTSAGYEGVDVAAATDLGIWVAFAPSDETGNAISVAEQTILLMIAASRNLNRATQSLRDPSFKPSRLNRALSGKTACIVGFGGIGRRLEERLRGFGVRTTALDDRARDLPAGVRRFSVSERDGALAEADYVVIAVPARKENENMVDAAFLAAMKPGSILVNVARGSLVDEAALAAAIRSGHVYAAGLDVVRREPVEPSDPLLELPEIVITPHIAGATDLMVAGTLDFLVAAIEDFEAGRRPAALLNAPPAPRRALAER